MQFIENLGHLFNYSIRGSILSVKKRTFLLLGLLQLITLPLSANTPMLLRLQATNSSMQNETTVYFDVSGSLYYNPQTDAPSLGTLPGYLNIVTRFDNMDYQTKCLPLLTQNISIPIKIITGVTDNYQISGDEIQNLPAGACLILHDNLLNSNFDLRTGDYNCSISDTESVARFVLNISISILPLSASFINPTCSSSADGYVSAKCTTGAGPWNYYWKDSLNNIIQTSLSKSCADTIFGTNAGVYRVDITSNVGCSNGTYDFFLEGTQSPKALFTSSADTASFTTEIFFTNTSINANSYWWDFGDGNGTADTNTSHYYASSGTFTVSLIANSSVCGDTSIFTKEITIVAQSTSIKQNSENKNMFISRDENGYYVKFNLAIQQDAIIYVTDLLGQKINAETAVKNASNQKQYLSLPGNENQVLVISAVLSNGDKIYKKIIN
jgi:PKD repeat protein